MADRDGVDGLMDPYAELGVPADADAETITRAFRQAARDLHPDAGATADAAAFARVADAFAVLRDPDRRAAYDRARQRPPSTGLRIPVRRVRRPEEPVDLPVSLAEAALGTTVVVASGTGPAVRVRVPPGSATGRMLRVPAVGNRAEMVLRVRVVVPDELTDDQRALLGQLRDLDDDRTRGRGRGRPHASGPGGG